MSDIEFVDELPGRTSTSRHDWDGIAAKLKAAPGQWALVNHYPNHNNANAGRFAMRSRGFETVTRRCGPDDVGLYARWPEAAS